MKVITHPSQMFEFLDETHQEIQAHLLQLNKITDQLSHEKLKNIDSKALKSICHFFNNTVRNHHLDEEKHVFPALIASGDEKLLAITRQLYQDHGWLESNWMELCPMLEGLIHQNIWFNLEELQQHLEVFSNLNLEHLKLEESIAYPGAKSTVWSWDEIGIGREMAKRRTFKSNSTVRLQ